MSAVQEIEISDDFRGLAEFEETAFSAFLDQAPFKTIAVTSGNRAGKTGSIAKHYVDRLLGICRVQWKNDLMRKVRCISSSLPENSGADEDDNAQYIELKKRIPPSLIEKDITARAKNMVVRRPPGLSTEKTVFEFRSSKQEIQDLGKISISSLWHDEETPKAIREECLMRLMEEDGDEIFSLTAINPLTWVPDEIFDRAEFVACTEHISETYGIPLREWRKENRGSDTGCFQMSTYDNPILEKSVVDRIFKDITDKDVLALRRDGIFTQISGKVVKSYDPKICYISMNQYFPEGVPYGWLHVRGIDFHESRTPWSIGWMSISPEDEAFLWQEFHPAIDGPKSYTTYEIAKSMLRKSGDYVYRLNLIDPLANKKQSNTGTSVTEDLNRYFREIHENTGLGGEAFWEGWDTKGKGGRDEVHTRFKNSVRCAKPFNNLVRENHELVRLPTLWIMDSCPNFNNSIRKWRFGEHTMPNTKAVNDPKNTPQQRFSHDNMVLEAFFKHPAIKRASFLLRNPPKQQTRKRRSVTGR